MSATTKLLNENAEGKGFLPQWQETLINQIFQYLKNYYCLPEKLNEVEFKKNLVENFIKINLEYPHFKILDQMQLPFNPDSYVPGQPLPPPPTAKKEFITEVNKVLKKFDAHLCLIYDPFQISMQRRDNNIEIDDKNNCARFTKMSPKILSSIHKELKNDNYGFVNKTNGRSSQIPRDIGYVKIKYFVGPRDENEENEDVIWLGAKQKAYEMMTSIRGKKAIIIDLRDSTGGSPKMVEYLISFLLKENGTKINNICDRTKNEIKEYKVQLTDFKLLNAPVYVLVNELTFSASEEFAYDLQQINKHVLKNNRFIIVGEATGGGAHPGEIFPLLDSITGTINNEYLLWLSTGNAINPYTNTNWEDQVEKGVQPDIKIKHHQDALEIAERHIRSTTSRCNTMLFKMQEQQRLKNLDVDIDKMVTSNFAQGSNTAQRLKNK